MLVAACLWQNIGNLNRNYLSDHYDNRHPEGPLRRLFSVENEKLGKSEGLTAGNGANASLRRTGF